jgi:hypothetical protein
MYRAVAARANAIQAPDANVKSEKYIAPEGKCMGKTYRPNVRLRRATTPQILAA